MTDLALAYNAEAFAADLCIENGDLVLDDGLTSLALMSLLTDARAERADLDRGGLDRESDLRGWWADAIAERPLGGRLWTLARAKATAESERRAEDFAREALIWMVADRIADRVDIVATRTDGAGSGATLRLDIAIHRPSGERVDVILDLLWRAMQ